MDKDKDKRQDKDKTFDAEKTLKQDGGDDRFSKPASHIDEQSEFYGRGRKRRNEETFEYASGGGSSSSKSAKPRFHSSR